MGIVVQKYGGSSVADIHKLRAVAERVVAARRAGDRVVVVVSAMGKTTENLLALAREAACSGLPEKAGAATKGEPPRRELDMLVSTGERVSMALLSIAIHARGFESISFTGSQSGIITNDRHFDARIIEVRPHRIEDELERGRIVIVAGYQGMSYKREITTLGRGGSDTSAVALAAALSADRCEIYSDVDGVYSADPRSVPDAQHLPELDYSVMQEMAECGAKVLNAQAVEWAKRNRVVIHARRTGDRPDAARETSIRGIEAQDSSPRAVVAQNKLLLIRAPRSEAARLLKIAEAALLPVRDLSLDARELVLCAALLNVPDFPRVRRALEAADIAGSSLTEGLGSVSLVGVDIGSRPDIIQAALEELAGREQWLISTPLRLTALIDEALLEPVARAWHARFVAPADSARLSA
jgi:aspartate kinase